MAFLRVTVEESGKYADKSPPFIWSGLFIVVPPEVAISPSPKPPPSAAVSDHPFVFVFIVTVMLELVTVVPGTRLGSVTVLVVVREIVAGTFPETTVLPDDAANADIGDTAMQTIASKVDTNTSFLFNSFTPFNKIFADSYYGLLCNKIIKQKKRKLSKKEVKRVTI
ncbi:MAG: hypothetical protein JW967_05725 [Dehalococcoidales bacterium]|nr:hypothetical protein [Dehalococcoidales bacterium]